MGSKTYMEVRQIVTVKSESGKRREYIKTVKVDADTIPMELNWEKDRREEKELDRVLSVITFHDIREGISEQIAEETYNGFVCCHNDTLDRLEDDLDNGRDLYSQYTTIALAFIKAYFQELVNRM